MFGNITRLFNYPVNRLSNVYRWDIQLNGVTLLNLMVAIGISVEFCAHMTHTFAVTPGKSRIR